MTFRTVRLLFLLTLCGVCFSASAQNFSNKGTDFWVAWMNHVRGVTGPGPAQMSLYLTSDVSTSGSVNIADGSFSTTFTISPNQVTIVNIPSSAFLAFQGQFLKGIHITSAKPIVVYAHIYAQAVSGASLVLPVTVLAKEYISINYTQQSNEPNVSYSAFTVIATEDETRIEVTPVAPLTDGKPAGVPFQVDLKKGEVYQGLSYSDLTGSRIRSVSVNGVACKKIAVFSGSGKVFIGCYMPQAITSDNLFQQIYPQRAWGKNYITVPLRSRPYDIYRVVLSDPATSVTINGQAIPSSSFKNGSYYEFQGTTPNVISADKPVQVVQYSVSERQGVNCTLLGRDLGDPEMIILSPVEQSVNNVTLYSSGYYAIQTHYVNIIIKKDVASSFRIDGRVPTGNFSPVPGNAEYVYGQFQVTVGTHTLSADDGFNAVAYGFGSAESYGYAAGTNVKDLKQNIQVQSIERNQVVTSGCVNEDFTMLITLGFPTSKLTWDIGNGSDPVTDSNPTAVSTFEKDGQSFYQYKFPGKSLYAQAGNYLIKVEAFNPVADECGSTENISLDLTIYNPPTAKFAAPDKTCLTDSVSFTDQSTTDGKAIAGWSWDFGDGTTSALKSPRHLYAKEGAYTVRLIAKAETGCASSVFEKTVIVNPIPVADFTIQNSGCKGEPVSIANKSTVSAGMIRSYIWSYGDGKKDTVSDGSVPLLHTFSQTGTFNVSLTVISDESCRAISVTKTVTIYEKPTAAFSVPKVCVNDAYAEFTNETQVAAGQTMTYHWDFGDSFSGAQSNVSTEKTPRHKYSRVGKYEVKLTVTNA
ncbi:MAG: PKD domain-containing protein, partial [Mucilaginibacter polytrichastri]|nr:PKD domain-containing protein [Mucilaginibacter polytrichastri]